MKKRVALLLLGMFAVWCIKKQKKTNYQILQPRQDEDAILIGEGFRTFVVFVDE